MEKLESFLLTRFSQADLDVVYFDDLTFEQQVKLMSKASMLISVHGAGLTNSIFMPSTSILIEIAPPHFHYSLYERIALQSGHIYFRFVTQYDSTVHSGFNFKDYSSRRCMRDYGCIISSISSNIKLDMKKFALFFEQVQEVL